MSVDDTFKDLKDGIFSTLIDTTRTAGQISNEDLAFHRSSNPSIVPLLEKQNGRLLQLARGLTRSATLQAEVTAPHITDVESVEDGWRNIVDVLDNLLEKADACLDEYTGVVRRLSPSQEDQGRKAVPRATKQRPDRAYRTQNIPKPQLQFVKVPTNDETSVFKPLLCSKPHSIEPFEESVALAITSDDAQQYKHPYETEIRVSQYPAEVHVQSDPVPYLSYEGTKATLVDTPELLNSMLEELKSAKEIAVDLEHHDEHSYIGLVSLMQISTRNKDWIVDTLKPWRHELQVLNEVFTDPAILKVFHGAFMDMIWLQRDFGLYVVGLFDTYHATRSLGYPKHGLAYLLKRFAEFDAAKQYQMADWRIRPLPEEMFDYARSDTHFLLYIYDNLRNELISKSDFSLPDGDLIKVVMNDSKEESLQRYERPLYDMQHGLGAMGWYNLLCRTPALFDREQFAVFRAAHQWRDNVARQEDESLHTIMSKNVLYNIARETPMDMPSLLGCAHPMSQSFRNRKAELLSVIKQAKILGATGPDMREVLEGAQPPYIEHAVGAIEDNKLGSVPAPLQPTISREHEPSSSMARTEFSSFWGRVAPSHSVPQILDSRTHHESLRLALPLPQLTAELYEDTQNGRAKDQSGSHEDSGAPVEHQYVKAKKGKEEDVFTIKQSGSSRKRKVAGAEDLAQATLPTVHDHLARQTSDEMEEAKMLVDADNAGSSAELSEKKRLKRAKKEARRLEESISTEAAAGRHMNEAFDYARAPSVLHAKRHGNNPGGKEQSRSEDPYLKSINAPKGMRKSRVESGGKSLTYRD